MSIATLLTIMLAGAPVMDIPNLTPTQKQIVQKMKNTKGSSTRLTPTGRYKKYLLPVNKNSFKQTQRKELNKSRKSRSKKF